MMTRFGMRFERIRNAPWYTFEYRRELKSESKVYYNCHYSHYYHYCHNSNICHFCTFHNLSLKWNRLVFSNSFLNVCKRYFSTRNSASKLQRRVYRNHHVRTMEKIDLFENKLRIQASQKKILDDYIDDVTSSIRAKQNEHESVYHMALEFRISKHQLHNLKEATHLNAKKIQSYVSYHLENILFPNEFNSSAEKRIQTLLKEKGKLSSKDRNKLAMELGIAPSRIKYYVYKKTMHTKELLNQEDTDRMKSILRSFGIESWNQWRQRPTIPSNTSEVHIDLSKRNIDGSEESELHKMVKTSIFPQDTRHINPSKVQLIEKLKSIFDLTTTKCLIAVYRSLSPKVYLTHSLQHKIIKDVTNEIRRCEKIPNARDLSRKFSLSLQQAKYILNKIRHNTQSRLRWSKKKRQIVLKFLQEKFPSKEERKALAQQINVSTSQLNTFLYRMKRKCLSNTHQNSQQIDMQHVTISKDPCGDYPNSTVSLSYSNHACKSPVETESIQNSRPYIPLNVKKDISIWLKQHDWRLPDEDESEAIQMKHGLTKKQLYNLIYSLRDPRGKVTVLKRLRVANVLGNRPSLETEEIDKLRIETKLSRNQIHEIISSLRK